MFTTERRGDVVLARFGEPARLNAMDEEVLTSLRDVALNCARERYRVLVLAGNEGAFSAGGDLDAVLAMRSDDALRARRMWLFREAFDAIADLPSLTIAAVDGAAFGGGLELVLACDLAVASDRSILGDGHINVGLVPGAGGTQRLPQLIGARRALGLALSGKGITAQRALEWGILNEIFPTASFWEQAWELAGSLAKRPPEAVMRFKRLIRRHDNADLPAGLTAEFKAAEEQMLSVESVEGVQAFLAKRREERRPVP